MFATGGEAGIVRVKALLRKFGPGSGAMSQKRSCMSRVEKGLSKASISRLGMVCNRKHNMEIKKAKTLLKTLRFMFTVIKLGRALM